MERSFKREVEALRLGAGETFQGEGILAVTKALLQAGVSYVGGYQGAPVSHLLDVMVEAEDLLADLGVHVETCTNEASAAAMLGASINYPLRGAVTWKSIVGTNVAADALSNLASPGVVGGCKARSWSTTGSPDSPQRVDTRVGTSHASHASRRTVPTGRIVPSSTEPTTAPPPRSRRRSARSIVRKMAALVGPGTFEAAAPPRATIAISASARRCTDGRRSGDPSGSGTGADSAPTAASSSAARSASRTSWYLRSAPSRRPSPSPSSRRS